ncbi:hypothetical protein TYRP_007821 [Tyrophagus putrescentiae]|nr:hypothetical protein TYRP_007821 [Tyrophagus putrescentiae]
MCNAGVVLQQLKTKTMPISGFWLRRRCVHLISNHICICAHARITCGGDTFLLFDDGGGPSRHHHHHRLRLPFGQSNRLLPSSLRLDSLGFSAHLRNQLLEMQITLQGEHLQSTPSEWITLSSSSSVCSLDYRLLLLLMRQLTCVLQ